VRLSIPALAIALLVGSHTSRSSLQVVAQFGDHQVTGVAVSPTRRIFVSFPHWLSDTGVSVAEVMPDGSLRPYPNAEWNRWRPGDSAGVADHFVCVQSVYVDPRGYLWILDPAAPGADQRQVIPHGPKLLEVDLRTNHVMRVYRFDEKIAPARSYLNDVRVDHQGTYAYLTESGLGALIVLDLAGGAARRVLEGHPSTQADTTRPLTIDRRTVVGPDGSVPRINADGIALSPDDQYLYYQALIGRTRYRVPTAELRNRALLPAALAAHVQTVGPTTISDGYWMTPGGQLYFGSIEDNEVLRQDSTGRPVVVAHDDRLQWPDSFAEGPDSAIYVTASQIQHMPGYNRGKSTRTQPYTLFRFKPQG